MKYFKILITFLILTHVIPFKAQNFEPKWIGEVKLLEIDQDTLPIAAEKANIQIKTTQSAGKILFDIGNVRKKCIIKGSKSPVQCNINKPIILVVKCKDNEVDPSTFIQIVKFEETRKERKTELAMENWIGNVSEMNSTLIPFEAEQYGKSSYLLTMQPQEGEFGVRVLNPETLDSKAPIFYCFGIHTKDIPVYQNSSSPTQDFYEYNGVLYPIYKNSDGKYYIMINKNDKIFIEDF